MTPKLGSVQKMRKIKYYLYRGENILGTVTHTTDDFPWHHGVFEPESCFSQVKHLFDQELKLVEDDEITNGKWDAIWDTIKIPGLKLVPISGGKEIYNFLIHIDGNVTWWRD